MACSSGNTTTTTITSSGSEGDMQHMKVDERKRKRMASNRECARRSRMRKQQHLDELAAQAAQLMRENQQVAQTVNLTNQQFQSVEAENCVLRAQMNELSQRLQSLNEILDYMNTLNGVGSIEEESLGYYGNNVCDVGMMNGYNGNFAAHGNNDPWNLAFLNQPMIASADAALLY